MYIIICILQLLHSRISMMALVRLSPSFPLHDALCRSVIFFWYFNFFIDGWSPASLSLSLSFSPVCVLLPNLDLPASIAVAWRLANKADWGLQKFKMSELTVPMGGLASKKLKIACCCASIVSVGWGGTSCLALPNPCGRKDGWETMCVGIRVKEMGGENWLGANSIVTKTSSIMARSLIASHHAFFTSP